MSCDHEMRDLHSLETVHVLPDAQVVQPEYPEPPHLQILSVGIVSLCQLQLTGPTWRPYIHYLHLRLWSWLWSGPWSWSMCLHKAL